MGQIVVPAGGVHRCVPAERRVVRRAPGAKRVEQPVHAARGPGGEQGEEHIVGGQVAGFRQDDGRLGEPIALVGIGLVHQAGEHGVASIRQVVIARRQPRDLLALHREQAAGEQAGPADVVVEIAQQPRRQVGVLFHFHAQGDPPAGPGPVGQLQRRLGTGRQECLRPLRLCLRAQHGCQQFPIAGQGGIPARQRQVQQRVGDGRLTGPRQCGEDEQQFVGSVSIGTRRFRQRLRQVAQLLLILRADRGDAGQQILADLPGRCWLDQASLATQAPKQVALVGQIAHAGRGHGATLHQPALYVGVDGLGGGGEAALLPEETQHLGLAQARLTRIL